MMTIIVNEIEFESRFESGNLRMAIRISENEYDLILKNDINANKYAQWFFFKLQLKLRQPKTIKFNIINCEKDGSPYSKGSRVLQFSESTKKWSRKSFCNRYYKNNLSPIDEKYLYTLSFTLSLGEVDLNETIYLSYCYPYTYTYLQEYLGRLVSPKGSNKIMNHEVLCNTLAGNNLDMLIITDFLGTFEEIGMRPCIILTSRVHPGESNSSFVIHGIIEFITGDSDIAKYLRKKYIFKIIPMLNPDGVVNGNFRANLKGKDLNRQWKEPTSIISPTILATKEIVKKTLLSRNIYLYCDFHGHSNKKNFFLYGCNNNNNKKGKTSLQEVVLAKLLEKKLDFFDYGSSLFKISPSKFKTGRAVIKKEFEIDFSYCLEASMEGISIGKFKNTFLSANMYKEIGFAFCQSIYNLANQELFMSILYELQLEEALKLVNNVSLNNNNKDNDSDDENCKAENEDNVINQKQRLSQKDIQTKDKLKLKPIGEWKTKSSKLEVNIEKVEKANKEKISISNKAFSMMPVQFTGANTSINNSNRINITQKVNQMNQINQIIQLGQTAQLSQLSNVNTGNNANANGGSNGNIPSQINIFNQLNVISTEPTKQMFNNISVVSKTRLPKVK